MKLWEVTSKVFFYREGKLVYELDEWTFRANDHHHARQIADTWFKAEERHYRDWKEKRHRPVVKHEIVKITYLGEVDGNTRY